MVITIILIIIAILIFFLTDIFDNFFQKTSGKIAISAIIISIGALLISKIYPFDIFNHISKCCLVLVIVVIIFQLIKNITNN